MKKINIICAVCGSADILKDAYAKWDTEKQEWVLQNVFDNTDCNICEGETKTIEVEIPMNSTNKELYKGTFNWYGETKVLYRYARSEKQAYQLFLVELSTLYDKSLTCVYMYFSHTDKYSIRKVQG